MKTLLSLLLLFPSLSFAENYPNSNLRAVDRLERVERDLNALQKQFYRGTGKAQSPTSYSGGGDTEAMIGKIEEQMRELNGKLEQLEFANTKLLEKFEKQAADYEFRFKELENKQVIKEPETKPVVELKEPAKTEPKADIIKEEYNKALALFKASNFKDAEVEFSKFIEKHPTHSLSGQVYYYLGESFFARKNYEKAAVNFIQSYKKFPRNNKAADSLFKLALSLAKLNRIKEACSAFAKIEQNYPDINDSLKHKLDDESARLKCE